LEVEGDTKITVIESYKYRIDVYFLWKNKCLQQKKNLRI